ncbi:mechanosensitive ion channel domain-containing protein [Pseudaminobacter sp. NGMCC 1.201702]|uniref:mechanosensitive ion channel domain-containing protein n=1 Tax=Pseudaminobacter sp. NGMCC 1.201702 TaxID=3391825 RepID=UPI0039F098DC
MLFDILRRLALLVLLASMAASYPLVANAQQPAAVGADTDATAGGVVDTQRQAIDMLTVKVDVIEKEINASDENEEGLVKARAELETIDKALLDSGLAFRPRLSEINSRIEQLGPPPGEGQPPEPELVAKERQALATEKAEINVLLGNAEDLSVRVNGLVNQIATLRRDLFTNMLTRRYQLREAFSGEVGSAAQQELGTLYRAVSSWLRFVVQFKHQAVLTATFLALLAAAILQFGGKRLFRSLVDRNPAIEEPSYLSRLSVAFWSTLLPSIAVSVFLNSTIGLYNYFNVLRGDIGVFLNGVSVVIFVSFFVNRLSHAVLSPDMPAWRLLPIESRPARILIWLLTAMALVVGVDFLMGVVSDTLSSPLSVTILKSLIAAITVGVLLILIGSVKPFADKDGEPRPWPATLRFLFYFLGATTIVSALLGYVSFAQFVSRQIVITGAMLATAYIGFLSSRAIAREGSFADTSIGHRLKGRYDTEEAVLDQLGLAASLLINILIVVVFLPLVLFQWGFQPGDIATWLNKLATGFQIGSFSFSPLAILTGLLVFALGYFVTRWFQGWLDGSVMARGKVDAGVRNSIRTIVGYAGLALATLIAISAAGINLSSLALIAGGLSLGIGFGLQNVVSNFVSGLILLAERPFKAGDWIVAGTVTGTVKKISVRATEIETFQRQTVILPNSELINSAVGNWTHRNKLGRIDIKVNVAYDSDAKRAHEIMLEITRGHPMVLKNPEPFVLFANFGPAALEFEIRAFLSDIVNSNSVQNDIRFSVVEAFAEEGIAIPSTARFIMPHEEELADEPKAELDQGKRTEPEEQVGRVRRNRRKVDPD